MKRTTIIETIIFLYTILFLYTGISKLIDYSVFKEQLSESPVLKPVATLLAATLPLAEFLATLLLFIPRWRLKGFYITWIMMLGFTIYVIALVSFDDKLPCSCGGIISALSWPQHIVFNTIFICLASLGIIMQKRLEKEKLKLSISNFSHDQSFASGPI